jgi:peptide/nickel transport system ATP-binding protein
MIKIDHLSTSYSTIDGPVHVINDVNFEIFDNEIFGIAGESGCGKTTLLKALYGILEFPLVVDSGKLIFTGQKTGKHFLTKQARSERPGGIIFLMCRRQHRVY